MNAQEAERALEGEEVAPCIEASIREAKELQEACLAAGIPALLGAEACGKPGCTPKAQLLVRPADVPRISTLLRERWVQMLEREGVRLIDSAVTEPPEGAEPPCPACGTAAPLVEGACSDCGLQLE